MYLIVKLLSESRRTNLTVLTGTRNPEVVPGVRFIVDSLVKLIEKRLSVPSIVELRYGRLTEKHDAVYAIYAYPFIPVAKKLSKKAIVHLHDYRPVSSFLLYLLIKLRTPLY